MLRACYTASQLTAHSSISISSRVPPSVAWPVVLELISIISGDGEHVCGALVLMPTSPAIMPVETGIMDSTRGGRAVIKKGQNLVVEAAASCWVF